MAARTVRAVAIALLIAAAIGGCGKSQPPEGYRSGKEAIAEAKRFQERAEQCFHGDATGRACAEAVALYEGQAAGPTHFATNAEWEEFSEPYLGGIHLLMRVSLKEMCSAPANPAASTTAKVMCAARESAIVHRIEERERQRRNCSVATASWPKSVGPFPPDGEPSFAQLRLLVDGTAEWNSSQLGIDGGWRPVDRNELRQLLQTVDSMPMDPTLVVDVAEGAKCGEIAALSNELKKLRMCQAGRCLEKQAWENYSAHQAARGQN